MAVRWIPSHRLRPRPGEVTPKVAHVPPGHRASGGVASVDRPFAPRPSWSSRDALSGLPEVAPSVCPGRGARRTNYRLSGPSRGGGNRAGGSFASAQRPGPIKTDLKVGDEVRLAAPWRGKELPASARLPSRYGPPSGSRVQGHVAPLRSWTTLRCDKPRAREGAGKLLGLAPGQGPRSQR